MNNNQLALVANNKKMLESTGIFKDVDFSGISSAIDKIGKKSGDLTPEEKVSATDIVNQWQNSVISRLRNYSSNMDAVLAAFKASDDSLWDNIILNGQGGGSYSTGLSYDNVLLLLDKNEDLREKFKAYEDAVNAIEEVKIEKPLEPIVDDSISIVEQRKMLANHQVELARYNGKIVKLQRARNKAFRAFIVPFLKEEKVKAMILKARDFKKNVSSFENECRDKSSAAKLNIQISSKEVRDALRSMLDFSVKF